MTIHLIAPRDKTKWHDIWHYCYDIWNKLPFEIKMWYDEDVDELLKNDDEDFFNIINSLSPIYKFDYVRYLILEKFGGAYFDMDVEIVDPSFFPKLNPTKFYYMEGTLGAFIDNSVIISSKNQNYNSDLFYRIKIFIKEKVITNFEDCTTYNVLKYTGPYSLSEWVSRFQNHTDVRYELLGQHQFSSTTNEISYTRHHQTSVWNKINLI